MKGIFQGIIGAAILCLLSCADTGEEIISGDVGGGEGSNPIGFGDEDVVVDPTGETDTGDAPFNDTEEPELDIQTVDPLEDTSTPPPEDVSTPDTAQDLPDPVDTGDPTPDSGTWLRVVTEETPSWVAWSEIEVSATLAPGGTVLDNIALGRPTESSGQTADGPSALAVDGQEGTSWNAGDFAPASISVDLGTFHELHQVRLLVGQNPPGFTRHLLQISDDGISFDTIHAFEGNTQQGDWLIYPPENVDPDPQPGDLPRGLAWVRNNPMFITGLCVSTPPPDAGLAADYFDGFHATAIHLWEGGLPNRLNGWITATNNQLPWVSWVNDHGNSHDNGALIGGIAPGTAGRIGYQIGDEPGLFGNGMEELLEIEIGVNAVRAADPDGLIIVNFSFWAEEIDEMLEYYGSVMDADVYSYDRYSMGYKEHETLKLIRDSAIKWERPYWRYLRSYYDVGDSKKPHTIEDYRWHAFIGLLYGYSGHTWFVYQASAPHAVASDFFPGQGAINGDKQIQWQWAAQINKEMRHIGRVTTQLESMDVRYVTSQSIYLPDGLVEWSQGAGEDPYLSGIELHDTSLLDVKDLALGFFSDGAGNHYIMVQNQQHPSADWPIDNTKDVSFSLSFDFSNGGEGLAKDTLLAYDHLTGSTYELPLVSQGNGTWRLDHTLPSAEPLFFKYNNGDDFPKGP